MLAITDALSTYFDIVLVFDGDSTIINSFSFFDILVGNLHKSKSICQKFIFIYKYKLLGYNFINFLSSEILFTTNSSFEIKFFSLIDSSHLK